jgi:hypothetical protein
MSDPELIQPRPAVVQPLVVPAVDSLQTLRPKSPGPAVTLAAKVVVAFEPLMLTAALTFGATLVTVALPLSTIGSACAEANGSKPRKTIKHSLTSFDVVVWTVDTNLPP